MAILNILPLNTQIKQSELEEIAVLVENRFSSKYSGVHLLDREEYVRDNNLCSLFSRVGVTDNYGFRCHFSPGGHPFIISYLHQLFGDDQDVLATTDLPLVEFNGQLLNGSCHTGMRKAILSRYQLPTASTEDIMEILGQIAIHEVGHMHGLNHHMTPTDNGKYCAMATGGMVADKFNQNEASLAHYKLIDNQFCNTCEQYL